MGTLGKGQWARANGPMGKGPWARARAGPWPNGQGPMGPMDMGPWTGPDPGPALGPGSGPDPGPTFVFFIFMLALNQVGGAADAERALSISCRRWGKSHDARQLQPKL